MFRIIPKLFKNCVVGIFYWTGLLWVLKWFNRNKIVILMGHGVVDASKHSEWKPSWPRLDVNSMDYMLSVLSRWYTFISIDDAVAILEKRKKPVKNAMVVSFDDGYRNVLNSAYPVLHKHDVPFIVYVSTGYVDDNRPFWNDNLDFLLQQLSGADREFETGDTKTIISYSSADAFSLSFWQLKKNLKNSYENDIEFHDKVQKIISDLEEETGKSYRDIINNDPWGAIVTWDDIEQFQKKGVDFGSHTVDHYRLALVDKQTALEQLRESKQMLEKHIEKECRHFCYPGGSYNGETENLVRKAGYISSLTTDKGYNKPGDNLMLLKRLSMPMGPGKANILFKVSSLYLLFAK